MAEEVAVAAAATTTRSGRNQYSDWRSHGHGARTADRGGGRAAGAAAAGLFLWSRRSQISNQLRTSATRSANGPRT